MPVEAKDGLRFILTPSSELSDPFDNQPEWPRLSCPQANQLALEFGELRIDESLTVSKAIATQQLRVSDTVTGSLSVENDLTVNNGISTNQLTVTGSLTVDNDLTVGNAITTNEVNASGTIRANKFEGDGSALTGISIGKWSDGISGSIYYNNGNVGIGTTTPTKKLEVTGEIQANGIIRTTDGFRPATDDWEIARNGEDLEIREPEQTSKVWARFKDDTSLHLIGTPHLWVDGNVGIGTTAPTHKFHVKSGNAVGLLESTGNQAYLRLSTNEGLNNRVEITNRSGGRLSLWTAGGGDVFNITRSGNVGIGTTSPSAKLDIDGTAIIQRTSQSPRVTIGRRDNTLPPETGLMIQNPSSTRATGIFVLGRNETLINIFDGETTFRGPVRFRSSKSGYVVDRCVNSSGRSLHPGDIVKLKATPIVRFEGMQNKIPIPEVTLADQENDSAVIGIVDSEFTPGPDEPDTRTEPDDPTMIPDGGELSVVTLGAYAHCKVDATKAPIEVGDLLTASVNPGHAQKATEPKIGSIIGKALEPLKEGTGYIAVFVNIQ